MEFDPSADIRKFILLNIDLDDDLQAEVITGILQRSRDIDASVRKAFFARLSLPGLKNLLKSQQLRGIYSTGLLDRDEAVYDSCLDCMCVDFVGSNDLDGLYNSLSAASSDKNENDLILEKALSAYFKKCSADQIRYEGIVRHSLDFVRRRGMD